MEVTIRPFGPEDLPALEIWDNAINGAQYMSRRSPAPNAAGPGQLAAPLWFVIQLDGTSVGTVWLERGKAAGEAILGILLGDPLVFGRGMGRRAIDLALEQLKQTTAVSRVTLNVRVNNLRAIACYARCGFTIVGTSLKQLSDGRQVRYQTMIKDLT